MLPDQLVQSVNVGHHADQTCHMAQRDDGVAADRQVFLASLGVRRNDGVDESKQLHDPLVLSYVLVAFKQENVLPAIVSHQVELPWMLLALVNRQDLAELRNPCDLTSAPERSWHSYLQIFKGQKLGSHIP